MRKLNSELLSQWVYTQTLLDKKLPDFLVFC